MEDNPTLKDHHAEQLMSAVGVGMVMVMAVAGRLHVTDAATRVGPGETGSGFAPVDVPLTNVFNQK